MVKTGGAVGGFAGPFMVGALADAFEGYTVAMLLLAGVAACAAALVYGELLPRCRLNASLVRAQLD